MEIRMKTTYLEGDMVAVDTNLELLLAHDVLFRPLRVVFPEWQEEDTVRGMIPYICVEAKENKDEYLLDDFAGLDNSLDFFHDKRANPH
jgi:hypothetical protein